MGFNRPEKSSELRTGPEWVLNEFGPPDRVIGPDGSGWVRMGPDGSGWVRMGPMM